VSAMRPECGGGGKVKWIRFRFSGISMSSIFSRRLTRSWTMAALDAGSGSAG
jgi:hypothetical protein